MVGRFTARRAVAPDAGATTEGPPAGGLDGASWTVFPEPVAEPSAQASPNPLQTDKLLDAKVRLHRRLIEEINLQALEKLPEDEMRAHIQHLVSQYVLVERLALNTQELNGFVAEILDEMTGLGPLEPLLKDPSVSDILINGHECVYVERGGVLEPCGVRFKDEQHLLRIDAAQSKVVRGEFGMNRQIECREIGSAGLLYRFRRCDFIAYAAPEVEFIGNIRRQLVIVSNRLRVAGKAR